jgi:GDP-4-dehydro-6-deoxy-D-mannose reductase
VLAEGKDPLRALVTGAAGFAGSHLAELLVSQGIEVYGLVMPGGPLDNLNEIRNDPGRAACLHLVEADIVQEGPLDSVIADTRPVEVYHLAAASSVRQSVRDPSATFRVNVLGTRNLLEAIRRAGLTPRILIVGSAEAYGASANKRIPLREEDPLLPVSPYGASKAAAELLACSYGKRHRLPIIRLRPFPHTGPRHSPGFVFSDWARQLAEIEAGRRPPRLHVGNLEIRRDISDVRDVVKAYRLVLQRGRAGAVYNVCSGWVYSLREVLEALVGLTRLNVEFVTEAARLRPHDIRVLAGTAQALHDCTGWVAASPLSQTLVDLLSYWRHQLRSSR